MSKKSNGLLALSANEATITTATVNIRTLRVGTKQLTQSVFRQLPKRVLIDYEAIKLLGTVWGWVNYTPADRESDFRQFVAQFGDELCRCPVPRDHRATQWENGLWSRPVSQAGTYVDCSDDQARRWNQLMDRLRSAPQLFIAV